MATSDKVVVPVEVQSNLTNETKKAKELNSELQKAAASSGRMPKALAAAKAGNEALNSGAQAGTDSSTARGLGGLTGAAGRDFAAQAQGLGGLVHVYATFAANIFALSAAFGALSKAADTTNMIKGLDQLGAASGRGLGSLAKQLSAVTDGAISLRDAMTATAQASAGGMSSENILRLGKVAKTASQALGIDMPNAVSRLSRGITKLEPELLDEIGIMVRVDKAAQDYARTLGKTASSLTDFEKRQGFANAVLEQGEKKFGVINIDANPYSKVLASIQNLSQAGLELINKVLGPLVSLLSVSPTALGATLAGIAAILLKQAIPSLTAWRENLERSATAARKAAIAANELRKDRMVESDLAIYAKQEKAIKGAEEALQNLNKTSITAKTRRLVNSTDIDNVTPEQIAALEKQAVARGKLKLLEEDASVRSRKNAANAQLEAANIKILVEQLKAKVAAEAELAKLDKPVSKSGRIAEFFSQDVARNRIADRLQAKSRQADIIGSVANDLPIKGTIESFRGLSQAIADARQGIYTTGEGAKESGKKMSAFGAVVTGVKGSAAILTSTISTLVSSVSTWIAGLGLAVLAFQALDALLSKNSKEAEATSEAFVTLGAAVSTVSSTLDNISRKDPLAAISTESIMARATALNELTTSTSNAFAKLTKQVEMANWWDILIDTVKADVGLGLLNKSAKEFSAAIVASFEAARDSATKRKAVSDVKDILGVDPTDIAAVNKVLAESPEKLLQLVPQVNKVLQGFNQELNNTASRAVELDSAFTNASKAMDSVLISSIPTDPLAKLGTEMVNTGQKMTEAFKDPLTALSQLATISSDVSKLRFLNPETAEQLTKLAPQIKVATANLEVYTQALEKQSQMESDLLRKRAELEKKGKGTGVNYNAYLERQGVGDMQLKDITDSKEFLQKAKAKEEAFLEPILKSFTKVQSDVFIRGAELLQNSISIGFSKAALSIQKNLADALGNTVGGIQSRADVATSEINLQLQQVNTMISLIESNEKLRLVTEAQTIQLQKKEVADRKDITDEQKSKLLSNLNLQEEANKIAQSGRYMQGSGVKTVISDLRSGTDAEKLAAQGSQGAAFSSEAKRAEAAQLAAQKQNIAFNEQLSIMNRQAELRKEALSFDISSLNVKKALIDLSAKELPYLSEATLSEKQLTDTLIAQAKNKQEILAVDTEIARLEKVRDSGLSTDKQRAFAKKGIEELNVRRSQLAKQDSEEATLRERQQFVEAKENALKKFQFEQQLDKLVFERRSSYEATLLSIKEENLNKLQGIGAVSPEYIAAEKASLEISKEKARNASELFRIEQERANFNASIDTKIAVANPNDVPALMKQKEVQDANYASAIANESALSNARITSLRVISDQNVKLAEQASFMEQLVSLTTSLEVVFGDVGKSIGGTLEAIKKLADTETNYLAKKAELEKDIKDSDNNPEKQAKLQKELGKLNNKNAKDEIAGYANIAKASKSMFKEKSTGYRLINNIEKAMHIAKMAMWAAENSAEIMATAKSVASSFIKIAADGPAAIVKTLASIPFPANVAAAATVAGIIATITGKSPGNVSEAGMTSEDRQQTQGTGMSWVNGKKVENGGGVFGDPEAKSESIVKSIDLLNNNMIEGLFYSKRMTSLLESINNGINKAAVSLYGVPGLRTGSGFGTLEGTVKGGGLLGSGIFGSKTSTDIIDSGISFIGSIGDLLSGKDINQFEDIKKTKKKWYGKTKTSYSTNIKELDDNIQDDIREIYANAAEVFTEVGAKVFGDSAKEGILEKFKAIDLTGALQKVSLKGLKGDELVTELNAVIASSLDMASGVIFSELGKFKQFGEGLLETVIRVVDGADKVKVALDSIGVYVEDFTLTVDGKKSFKPILDSIGKFTYEVSEALIESAGGLDRFTSQITFFSDNFLTEAERLEPIIKNVSMTMAELGYSSVDTREEFKNLVQSIDITSESGRELYQALQDIAPAFAEVYEATKEAASAQELYTSRVAQTIEILKLEGKTGEALILQRLKDLEAIDDSLKAGQLYLYALQDEAAIKSQIKTAYDKESAAIKTTISSIKRAITTLKDFRESLLLSDKSNLTPLQKYEQTKSTAMQVAAIATGIANTDAEKQAKEEALAKLPTVTSAFLEASRTLFASSGNYNTDLSYVLEILDSTSTALDSQLTESERQLEALTQSVSLLNIIEDNTSTTAQLLSEYAQAQSVVAQAQASYSMNLNALTAEMLSKANLNTELMSTMISSINLIAPNLVQAITAANSPTFEAPSTTVPTQVVSQDAANQALIAEIEALREEVAGLRADQQQQTGDIIATNYDANNQTVEPVVSVLDRLIIGTNWRDRNAFNIS